MTDHPANAVMEAVAAQGVVAIVRTRTAVEGEELVDRLLAAGLRAVEVSLSTPDAVTPALPVRSSRRRQQTRWLHYPG
jgi:2-keto-3-deoxy-6-phosphogluconate aldolase